jgi:cyclopropane fatty-acyl-phospholipid synthase-like methyltransferase
MLGFLCLSLIAYFIPGCSQQTNYKKRLSQAKSKDPINAPIGYNKIEGFFDKNVSFSCYEGKQNIQSVLSFYKKSLELEGWDIVDSSINLRHNQEGLLIGNKPHKHIVISIRPRSRGNGSSVHIFLQNLRPENGNNN